MRTRRRARVLFAEAGGNCGRAGWFTGVRLSGDSGPGKGIAGGGPVGRATQGSACRATLGWGTQPRWGWLLAVDCVQLAAAVGPASLLAGGEWLRGASFHAAASCEHHSGSRLPPVHGTRFPRIWRSRGSGSAPAPPLPLTSAAGSFLQRRRVVRGGRR